MTALAEHLQQLRLVDHHVHGVTTEPVTRERFENQLNEGSTDPLPSWDSGFDTQLGFAIRAHCAPLIGLPAHADADTYWDTRAQLDPVELARVMTSTARVSDWLVDEGFSGGVCSRAELAALGGGSAYEIVRLETIAENAVAHGGDYAATFSELLRTLIARDEVVGMKTIAAYRTGFGIDWAEPDPAEVRRRADAWRDSGGVRLADPVLIAFGVRTALRTGLPLQFHVGFGDRDEDMHRCDPMLLIELLRDFPDAPVTLLHCYPFERQAGYLAQSFAGVHLDVGLAVNYLGARSAPLLARAMELAPFRRLLFSSDAYGPGELHALGAMLWRRGMTTVLNGFVDDGEWSLNDAQRVATLIGRDNARRLYQLG